MNSIARARRFDLIAFDWDGTLFDSTAIIVRSIQAAVRDVGGATPSVQAASYVIGMALPQALAHAAPDVPPERYPELGQRYRYHYMQHQDDLTRVPVRKDALEYSRGLVEKAKYKFISQRPLESYLYGWSDKPPKGVKR
jgi:phosphoglycolate phosphatase-like HAD superfamily hydrolase